MGLLCVSLITAVYFIVTAKTLIMKRIFTTLLSLFSAIILFAQDVRLSDSVIFINNEPVAFYAKSVNESPLRYNIEVYNSNDDVLIKAEVIKFNAPIDELKPFYYYELTFPPTGDTLAIYLEDEAFPLVLGKIISDYKLISKEKLNRRNVGYFRRTYYGGPALKMKLKTYEEYLDRTRYYYEQVKRDRTKPVKIINDRVIMQDGVKIGLVTQLDEFQNRAFYSNTDYSSGTGKPVLAAPITNETTTMKHDIEIFLLSQRKVDFFNSRDLLDNNDLFEGKGKKLYEISRNKKIVKDSYQDKMLKRVCYLVEEYAL